MKDEIIKTFKPAGKQPDHIQLKTQAVIQSNASVVREQARSSVV
jgi:hypothetical protein